MAIYYCDNCDQMHDDDYNPGYDVDGELYCEDSLQWCDICADGFKELADSEDEEICQSCYDKRLSAFLDKKEAMEAAAEDYNDDKRRGLTE